jgi:hypothetical protein
MPDPVTLVGVMSLTRLAAVFGSKKLSPNNACLDYHRAFLQR